MYFFISIATALHFLLCNIINKCTYILFWLFAWHMFDYLFAFKLLVWVFKVIVVFHKEHCWVADLWYIRLSAAWDAWVLDQSPSTLLSIQLYASTSWKQQMMALCLAPCTHRGTVSVIPAFWLLLAHHWQLKACGAWTNGWDLYLSPGPCSLFTFQVDENK